MTIVTLKAPTQLQRTFGAASLAVRCRDGTTRLVDLREEGAARIRLPRGTAGGKEAVLVNTAGGLTDGDRLDWRARVGAEATLTLTTQACERIYRAVADRPPAHARTTLDVAGTALWLPQETILFDGSALDRTLDVSLSANARFLACESLLFGRLAMGERRVEKNLRDRWNVRREGRLVHAERLRVEGETIALLDRPAIGGGARAIATVVAIAPEGEGLIGAVRDILGPNDGAAWCQETGRLVARLSAPDGRALRHALVPLLQLLARALGATLPKVWSL